MKSSIAVVAAFGFATVLGQEKGVPKPSTVPLPDVPTSHGCYKSLGNLEIIPQLEFPSSGKCAIAANEAKKAVFALYVGDCYLGDAYPPKADSVSDSNCHYPCPGFDPEACGGIEGGKFYSVFNSGVVVGVPDLDEATPSQTPSPTTQPSSTAPGQTVIVTQPPESDTTKSNGGGTSAAAIAAAVVVSILGVAAIIGGVFFFMRRKRNKEIEEEHRRNAAVNAFIGGGHPPSSVGSISMTDSRLDPHLTNRRLSDGSIADNQDYSRKILRVTNV